MFSIKSPTTYNEMLGKLGSITFFSTLCFCVILRATGLIPLVEVDESLIPPIKQHKEIIEWGLSFGIVPFALACVTWFLSSGFEIHNKLAKVTKLRYFWDKYYIVKVMLERSSSDKKINDISVRDTMYELYYPEVKNIDQHYVHTFWRYALIFWSLFEHLFFATVLTLILLVAYPEKDISSLWYYLLTVSILTFAQFLGVTVQKSKDQAKQINIERINTYFKPKTNILT